MKRVLFLLFVALSAVAGALLLWHMRSVVVMLLAAIALGASLRPMASRLSGWGMPRTLSALLMVLLVFVLVLGGILILGFALGEELPMLLRDVQLRAQEVRTTWSTGAGWQQTIAENISAPMSLDEMFANLEQTLEPAENAGAAVEETGEAAPQTERERAASAMLRLMITSAGSVAGFIGQFVILIFVSLYWSLEHEWFERLWISLLPARMRQSARTTWREVEVNVGAHIRSEVLQSLLAGLVVYLGFRLMGVDQPLLLATIVALAWLIPLIGGVVALVVLIPIALLSPFWVAVASAVLIGGVLAFMEFVLEPRLDKGRERLEIFGLIMAMIMLQLGGILGLLIASPLAVAIASAYRSWENAGESDASQAVTVAEVRRRLAGLRQMVAAKGDALPMRTRSLYERLETLVDEAQEESNLRLDDFGPQEAKPATAETLATTQA